MTNELGELDMALRIEGAPMADRLQVITADLGEGNQGAIGPDTLNDTLRADLDYEIGRPEYQFPADINEWWCVDGRIRIKRNPGEAYPSQIAGSIPVSETAAEFMLTEFPEPQSKILAEKTIFAVEDGLVVVVHGDDHKKKDGCAANLKDRDVLRTNAANIDQVAPRVLAVASAAGLEISDFGITDDDVVEFIVRGGKAAENSELFDVTAEEKIEIMIENGAKYVELKGSHNEKKVVIENDADRTFNATEFARSNVDPEGVESEVFVVSAAAYAKQAFERGAVHGVDKRDIALQCLAVIAFNIGVAKLIGNQNLEAALVSGK